ncbi:hypothetical protein BD779DRAFT_1514415, partial [Infundibulicybe gibba]
MKSSIPPPKPQALPTRRGSSASDTRIEPTTFSQKNVNWRRVSSPDEYDPPEPARSTSPAPPVTPSPPVDFTTPAWTLALKPIRASSTTMTDDMANGGCTTPISPSMHMAPQDAYKAVIRAMSTVVIKLLDWRAAQNDMDQWKRAQHTPDYAHASTAMRIKFDAIRAEHTQMVMEAQRMFKHSLNTLSDLPDLIDAVKSPAVVEVMDVATITSYTDELQMWLSDFKKIQAEIDATKTPSSPSPSPPSPTPSPFGISILEKIKALPSNQWTWDVVKQAQTQLEESLDQANEIFFSNCYMDYENIDTEVEHFFDGKILETSTKSTEATGVVTANLEQQLEDLVPKIDAYGDDLEGQTSPAVKLLGQVTRNEQLVARFQAEVEANTKLLDEIELLVEDSEQKEGQKEKKIRELADQIS